MGFQRGQGSPRVSLRLKRDAAQRRAKTPNCGVYQHHSEKLEQRVSGEKKIGVQDRQRRLSAALLGCGGVQAILAGPGKAVSGFVTGNYIKRCEQICDN